MRALVSLFLQLAAVSCLCACVTPPLPDAEKRPAPPRATATSALISGNVVTPSGTIRGGWILIRDGKIAAIEKAKPNVIADSTLVTSDYIYPAFVDLHNHPMFNTIARWSPQTVYPNRYAWRDLPEHQAAVSQPANELVKQDFCAVLQFAEVRALVGGTSSFSGIGKGQRAMPGCMAGLVRNIDWQSGFHGPDIGNERVRNLLGVTPRDLKDDVLADVVAKIKSGDLDLVAVHLAEGKSGDAQSRGEFATLAGKGLLTDKTAIVHGIALDESDFRKIASTGAALVWSPRSNIELYGETTDVAAAKRNGVLMALAPDWSPTGSVSMLDELRYADRYVKTRLNGALSTEDLFRMATANAARIAKLDDKVGTLAPGLYADLFLVRSGLADPYQALLEAVPGDITLVMIDGLPVYGGQDHLSSLGAGKLERLVACGVPTYLNAAALYAGPFAAVQAKLDGILRDFNTSLAPVFECH